MAGITINTSTLRQARWYELGVRFLLGGLITVITGLVAQRYGPGVAGLFLAFPAIFPAAATLVAKHEQRRKQQHGMAGVSRGKSAAAVEACGAAMGSVGLLVFAAVVWRLLPEHSPALILAAATAAWAFTAILIWLFRHRRRG